MKYSKLFAIIVILAVAAFLAPAGNAQVNKVAAAGSSAVYQASLDDAIGLAECGANHFTLKNGGIMHDNRTGDLSYTIQDEKANLWVTWDGGTDGTGATVSCIYVAVDSGIGVRGYMANPRASLFLNIGTTCASSTGVTVGNLSLLGGDSPLPTNICNIYGTTSPGTVTMNLAFSDVRPEDAQFQAARSLSKLASGSDTNVGYGNWPNVYSDPDAGCGSTCLLVGNVTYQSAFVSSEQSVPVWYELSRLQNDAFSGSPIQTWQTYPVGAIPVLIIVNNSDTSDTGLGNGLTGTGPWTAGPYAAHNLNHFEAGYIFNGSLNRTIDVIETANPAHCSSTTWHLGVGSQDCSMTELQREGLSGTYTTFEFSLVRSHAVQASQEDNVPTSGVPLQPTQPLSTTAGNGSRRLRCIGTGECVNAIAGSISPLSGTLNTNRIAYAFWSYGNLKALRGTHNGGTGSLYKAGGAPPLGHYLTIDGTDPLFTNSGDNPDGALNPPICTATPCPVIPFTHIIDGSYPVWTVVQAIVPGSVSRGDGSVQDTFLHGVLASAAKYSDFLPVTSLNVFRSHRDANVVGVNARNGNGCGGNYPLDYNGDAGQAAGGAIFNIQSDLDYAWDVNGQTNTCLGLAPADSGLEGQQQ